MKPPYSAIEARLKAAVPGDWDSPAGERFVFHAPTDLRALLDRCLAFERFLTAYDRCEQSRGAFSCVEDHDCRCPKSRSPDGTKWIESKGGKWGCRCGRDELDAAYAALDKEVR
jgi:hypothetical protein